jgi:ketosteroid isomerase-like protein
MNEKEILALEDKRFGAMIARDFKALEAMLHGDLLYTHSSGVTDTKATWLQAMQSGKTKYKSVNCTDRKVRVIGDVALVTGRAAIEAEIGGQPRSLKLLFLNAWAKTPQGLEVRRLAVDPARGLSEGFKGRRASMSPHFTEATTSESATARRFAAVPSFGSDRSEADIPRASGACRSDENDPKRQSLE